MASDLSSGSTEVNEIFDDEKEEGEISLEDISSSEDGPPYRYQSRLLGQCPHCLSIGHCATWCRSLTLNKKIFIRASQRKPLGKVRLYVRPEVAYILTEDAGKENRRHHRHRRHGHRQGSPGAAALDTEDFQPISSDSDLELVGLAKKKKTRKKKRRKKSLSLSLSPSPVDLAIKDSIHREPTRRHQSPARRKAQQQQQTRKSPPPRKPSPQRMKKLKKFIGEDSPLQSRGTVTKLLKKVKKLEPFSTRCKENRSSLKDKLSNIIGGKKSDDEETVVVQMNSKEKSPEVEKREIVKELDVQSVVEKQKKQELTEEEKKQVVVVKDKKREVADDGKTAENGEAPLRKIASTAKHDKSEIASSEPCEVPQPTPPAAKKDERPQEPDEDLQLRVIALRSAVMKKHRTRMARANKKLQLQQQQQQQSSSEPVPRIESPFTSSFNEDFPLLAEICSPSSPLDPKKDDIYCPEDMELDSDMELDREVTMVLSGAEEESNNIVNGDSPYSPTDDLGSPQATIDQPMDLSMYTPTKPTETSMIAPDSRTNDTLDGSIFESRPYSPSDATVYDPELPGVLATNTATPQPLQLPPLPPLGLMPLNPMNLLGTFPIMPMNSFAPVNPMLTAPFIPIAPTLTTTASNVATSTTQLIDEFGETDLDGSPLVPIEPKDTNWKFLGEPFYLPEMNKLTLPGLVPAAVLRCNKQLQKTPPSKKPNENLFKNAEMMPVAIEENKAGGATFKPIKLATPVKKAVTTQSAAAFDASVEESVESQKQIWPDLEQDLKELEELEEQENRRRQEMEEKKKQEQRETEEKKKQEQREAEEKKKQREAEEKRRYDKVEADRRKKREREETDRRRWQTPIRRLRHKSVTPAPRTRRRSARTPSRARDTHRYKSSRSSRDSENSSKSNKTENSKKRLDEANRKLSIDDDEQALREILLASLAKRRPNAKRKAALEAAKRKAILEATKTTSDKENIAEKSAEATPAVPEVDKLKQIVTIEKPTILERPQSIPTSNAETDIPLPLENPSSVLMPAVLQVTLKRPASTPLPLEQPLRKVVKKSIPASTRVVNNAKRYQNLQLQRKLLTQQKLALYKTRFAENNSQRPESPQVIQLPSVAQRFVISLNEDTESESEADEKKKASPTKSRPALAIPTSDFEKSVDQFLKGVRMQQELLATTTTDTISKPATPSIVATAASNVISKTVTTTTIPAITVTAAAPVTAKIAVTTSETLAKVAVTTFATISVPKTTMTTMTTSSLKERTVLKIPKPTTTASILPISATPQAVKHLPASQQEEYRRLKQQIYEYEQLRLQKAKEFAAAAVTTFQSQPTMVKPVNTSSNLTTPLSSPMVLASSTPKTPVSKLMPKTQLIAAISPMSKRKNVAPVIVTPTKIIHSTSSVTTKTNLPTINIASKATSSSITVATSSKPVTSVVKITQPDPNQLKLLSKITESLNSQKTLLNTAASKISSLRVLTKEQINQKTSQIQKKNNCVMMDDLMQTAENNAVTEKTSSQRELIEGEKTSEEKLSGKKVEKVSSAKEAAKKTSSTIKKTNEDKSQQSWEDFRQVVNDEVEALSNLASQKQKKLLAETEEKLISKRHSVLDDITEMSGNLRQWEIERDLQNIISAEIISLREQLYIAEEKLKGQKMKLQTIQPKVTLYHEKINIGRKECFRLSKICNGLGQKIVGSDYKVPTAGAELLNNRIKEVATHTQKLRGKNSASVQSNNSAKTGRTLKSNSKVNVNPNSGVKEINKKQKNVVDLNEKSLHAIKEKISKGDSHAVVSNIAKMSNAKNIFNKKTSYQPMDIDNENLSVNRSSDTHSTTEELTEEPHSTNTNNEQHQSVKGVEFAKSETDSEKNRESHSEEAGSGTVDNSTTPSMEIDHNTADIISNHGVGTSEESNSIKNTIYYIVEASNMEIVHEIDNGPNNELSNNNKEKLNLTANTESEIKTNVNNNIETPSLAIANESQGNTINKTVHNIEMSTMEEVDRSKCTTLNEAVNDSATSSKTVVKGNKSKSVNKMTDDENGETLNKRSIGESDSSAPRKIIQNNSEVLDIAHAVHVITEYTTSSGNEQLPIVQVEQSVDIRTNSAETNPIDQNKVSTGSENIVNEICSLNSILNNTVEDAPDKMDNTENVKVNNTDETRTDEQSTNSGPKTVITNNVESDSVNNNTSCVVNTSFDDYMKEMTVSDEYDDVCSKDYKSRTSITSNEHSTTFEEEIRLLELASKSEAPHEFTNDCQSIAKKEHESIADCQSDAEVQQGNVSNCQPVANEKHESDCQSRDSKTEQHTISSSSSQSLLNKISKKAFRPYESVLKLVRAPRNEKTDGILCPFALMGTCIDGDCRYIHQPTSHCQ